MITKNRKPILILLTLIFSFSIVLPVYATEEESLKQIEEIYDNILEYHVDSPNSKQLMDGAIKGMIDSLNDPYTSYLTEEEFTSFMNSLDGSFIGVGVYLELMEEGIIVQSVIPKGPADTAGMKAGDQITHVNGHKLSGTQIEEATQLILGEEGTEVTVTVTRLVKNKPQSISVPMVRKKITLPNVEISMLPENVGYLKLHRFAPDSYKLADQHLQRLEKLGMEKLILDLRGNPGGLLDVAVQMASLFKESGTVLHVKDNSGKVTPIEMSSGKSFDKPLVVLVDEGSASASEVLAGFLQESVQATVIGKQSFGKGTVQRLIGLETGGVLKITVNEYFTPKMNQVNKKGITPKLIVAIPEFQLAKAFGYLTKKNSLKLTSQGNILLNGLKEDPYSVKAVKKNGEWYIPIRTLTEWNTGGISWNEKKKSIDLHLFNQAFSLQRSDIWMEKGRSYISLEDIVNRLPFTTDTQDRDVIIFKK